MTHYETHYFGPDKFGRSAWHVYHTTTRDARHEELRNQYGSAYTIRYMTTAQDNTALQATVTHPSRDAVQQGTSDKLRVVGRTTTLAG